MTTYLALMIVGFVGLLFMALPGLIHGANALGHGGHTALPGHGLLTGHSHALPGHGGASHGQALPGQPHGSTAPGAHHGTELRPSDEPPAVAAFFPARLIPSPRAVFTIMALFGAFGYALMDGARMVSPVAGAIAIVPAFLIERVLITPLWNFMFRYQGAPATSLDELLMGDAEAVTPFHNGRGIVRVIHDGRTVQLSARLMTSQETFAVGVGDTLRIEDVDAAHERVTVSIK